MLDKIAKEFDFQQRSLNLRAYRAEVIASNVANAETPHYKAVDFDFKQALLAGQQDQRRLQMARSDGRHYATQASAVPGVGLQYRNAVQRSLDGNTVDMDVERAAYTDNALKYQSTLSFLTKKISGLNDVIRGGQ